jgi:hypothetical protein
MDDMRKDKLEAVIEHEGDEKYILAQPEGEHKVVLVSMPKEYHSEIARAYTKRLGKKLRIFGGGILRIDKEAQTVKTYGMSGSYGKPKVRLVEKILEYAFPGYTIEATVTDYIR